MTIWSPLRLVLLLVLLGAIVVPASGLDSKDYVPPELQVSDAQVKASVDAAEKLGEQGKYSEAFQQLQTALKAADSKRLVGEKALIEAKLGSSYFVLGKVPEAKQQFLSALADGVETGNLVLQADTLVALAGIAQLEGNLQEALDGTTRALDFARKSKNLFIQSRCLGELGHLQLTAGKREEARASVEEALRIDRLNHYQWEPSHLLYQAWIAASESKKDEALQLAISARDLAVKQENYLVFMQASESLGQAYAAKGEVAKAIAVLEHARDGVSDTGAPLFQHPEAYRAGMALPYPKIVFLEALAIAYHTGQRLDDALKTCQELYDTASAANFPLAAGEAAHGMAEIYKDNKNDPAKATEWYARAAEAWNKGGNSSRRIDAMSSEAFLLSQQGEAQKAIELYEQLLPLLDAAGNRSREFLIALSIAEIAQPRGDLEHTETALKKAESLLGPDLTLQGLDAKFIFELFTREAGVYQNRKAALPSLIAMEKAFISAEAAATVDQRVVLDREAKATLDSLHAHDTADSAYASGDLPQALLFYELVQHFEENHALWMGQSDEYYKSNDPVIGKLLDIPFKLIEKPEGAAALEKNLEQMGPIAQMARLPILTALSNHYFRAGRNDQVVKFVTMALPQLRLGDNDQPNRWDVQLACELAGSLLMEKHLDKAVERVGPCLRSAQKLGDPQLLAVAHYTRMYVMQAAGRASEAQESARFLAQESPDDPQFYIQIAQLKTEEGANDEATEALKKALQLYDTRKDFKNLAETHISLANSLRSGQTGSSEEVRVHLEAALVLFRQLGDTASQARSNILLGNYFGQKGDTSKALEYLNAALELSRKANEPGLQAWALTNTGDAYRKAEQPRKALDSYRKSAELFHLIKDAGNEAIQVRKQAEVLDGLHETQEALETYLQARQLADSSDSWVARYWVRRILADHYDTGGEYEDELHNLKEARDIANAAHQPLNAAWASLALAQTLALLGEREEAIDPLNAALPVFQKFKDVEKEGAVYAEFIDIYGARESEVKDFDKALQYYQSALQLATKNDPARAVSLNLDAVEIYWQQKKFKEAASLAREALEYYEKKKDNWGEANSLFSLAEVQRSSGDLQDAAASMKRAEACMKKIDDFYMIGRLHYGLANQKRAEGHYQEAINEYDRVVKMLEQFKSSSADDNLRRKASNTYGYIYDELIDTYYHLGEQQPNSKATQADNALQEAELNKARVFTTSWGRTFVEALRRQLPAAMQEKERELSARQDELQAELVKAQSGQGARPVKQVQEDQKRVAGELEAFAKELRKVSPAYAAARFPEVSGIASLPLRPGEVFLEFKMLDEALLVWMIEGSERGPQLVSFYKVEHPRDWFEERIMALRSAFNRAQPDLFDPQVAEELFNALFPAPVAGHLTSAKAVIFVPDDILFLLPFELLSPQASHSQFVLLKVPTSYFPSASALRLSRSIAKTSPKWEAQFFGMADPVTSPDDERYAAASILTEMENAKAQAAQSPVRGTMLVNPKTRDYFFSRLPDTAVEVKNIAGLFPADPASTMVLTGVEARKREVLETDLGRFRFVHFATHGFFPVEPGIREPALVLSYDGKDQQRMMLTLSEVVQLKLHADMVVLSACNTGSGKVTRAEGVSSLGTAFLAAGAESATTSLWKVSDKSTAMLMQEFYKGILNGMPKNAALAAARSALVTHGYTNPFYWAPFVLTGE
jgi:CHAT domain-containing protein